MREEDNYWNRAMQRRLSRRAMLRNAGLAGLGLAGTAILGCNDQGKTQPTAAATAAGQNPTAKSVAGSSPVPTMAVSPTPSKPSGSLKIAVNFGAGQIDPQLSSGQNFQVSGGAIFDSLIRVDPNEQLIPGIAEKWEIATDGLSHTFYIRKGVKFHDGSDLTGADVKYSLERMIAPEGTNQDAALWRVAVSKVDLKDDYTVVVQMKQPQLELIKGYDNAMGAVVPKKYIEEKGVDAFRKTLVGSGPWKAVRYEAGNLLELEALESHWRKVPQFKNLTLVSIPEEATKVAMLKTGELDMGEVAPDSVAGLQSAGVRVFSYNGGGVFYAWPFFDLEHPETSPFSDVRVRKAMQLAINQQELADKILGGRGAPYALFYVSSKAYFFDSNVLKPDPFDPDQAKKLLAEAGLANGFNFKIYDTGGGGLLSTIDQALAGYWKKIGLNAEISPIEYSVMNTLYNPKHKPEIWNTVFAFQASTPRGYEGMSMYHSTRGQPKNVKNPRLNELVDLVPRTADPTEKKKLALEAATLAKNQYSALSVVGVNTNIGLGSKIGELPAPGFVNRISATMFETLTRGK